jgi:predicted branched-subunit amino acid permease
MHLPRWQRMCHGYFTADITYVLFIRQYPQPGGTDAERTGQEAYLAGNYLLNWGSWIVASLLGVGLANLIPPEWGLGFAGILCLLGIQCSLASSRMRILSATVAGVAAVVAYHLPLKLNIVVAIAVAVILCLTVEKIRAAPKVAA